MDSTRRRMAGALFFVVAALMSPAVPRAETATPGPSTNTCTTTSGSISVSVDQTTKTVSFICGTNVSDVLPSAQDTVTQYYEDKNITKLKNLVELFGMESKGTIKSSTATNASGKEVSLTLTKLPEKTTDIYFGCAAPKPREELQEGVGRETGNLNDADTAKEKCIVTVTVPADPNVNTCTLKKQNMDLKITNTNKSVSFQCDTGISTLTPKNSSNMIFDELCDKQVKLQEVLPTATLVNADSRYTFSVGKLPETSQTFCYKCSASEVGKKNESQGSAEACTVKVKVAAANLDSAASTSATAGSMSTLVFGFVSSVAFSTSGF
ncbi:SAG-related sequence SRS53F [Toxoplasma gondii TgCatPRC2]|uniref:SAG-related sequence SRS53F n=6 Tax=Toxoplasma gondii TaxID=5811 RepID=A0A125YPY0_TOXGV|nr:SAG-related sequence SRS53F [Toxoplasma gondii ME49]ESS35353.1 SAG-related sequence SRS53F [Toxoplasma gondii VEG]KFG36880.1 SAG-related sequence SRS53F [Toxoplasma gondii GAB2-2007-GAL-DOM2]KYF40184.1 SAG-related sequence SRS53F [Toxoplasma gondii ARI]KYK65718.1 SAG-related sequence SRS53F [Toxoplasma gondii TgCatPRC2]EPT25743.1 SAG-related sequence SRS53F [Toxoplasma gondii ME49]|eukprot:XP_002364720.2 SAG-related sequence SRS53F [Toxoplasma gondii ME49]